MQKSITNSDGKVYMDYYKYPFDHTSSYPGQQTLINQLKDQHRLGAIYSEKKVNGTVVDISESLFGLFGGIPMVNNIKRRGVYMDKWWTAVCR